MGEQSEMSQASTMSQVSTTGEVPRPEQRNNSAILAVLACLVIILVIGGTVYGLTAGGGGGEREDDTESGNMGTGGGGDSGIQQPSAYVSRKSGGTTSTTKATTVTTEESEGTSETADDFNEPPTSPRPIPKPRKSSSDVLICTISHNPIYNTHFPPDNLCDIVFYTDVYYSRQRNEFVGSTGMNSFVNFVDKANSSHNTSRTAYGVSFDYENAADTSLALEDKKIEGEFTRRLWNKHIEHYGILHAWDEPSSLKTDNSKLSLIARLRKITDSLKQRTHREVNVELAIGFQFLNGNDLSQTGEVAGFIQRYYQITILVAITHMFKKKKLDSYNYSNGPSTWEGCYTYDNKKADCPHIMKDIAEHLKNLIPRDNVAIMVSFTMAATYWEISKSFYSSESSLRFKEDSFWRSTSLTHVEHLEKCKSYDEPVRIERKGRYYYTGSPKKHIILAYDTPETLQRKMELYVELMGTRPGRQGFAAYDVNYDDYNNTCKYPVNFQNLRTISRFVHL